MSKADVTDPEGLEIIKRLLKDTDVMLEAYRPGTAAKLGLDYESVKQIKPDIIYCSVSAYGQTGRNSKKPGYDLVAQALSGNMFSTGTPNQEPQKFSQEIGDFVGGLNAYGAIAAALYYRERTGEGQSIDIALVDGLVAFCNSLDLYSTFGMIPKRMGNASPYICPYGLFTGKGDQSIVICAPNARTWNDLCKVMGCPEKAEDPMFSTMGARCKNLGEVTALIEGWLKTFDDINDAAAKLDEVGVPSAKVATAQDVYNNPDFLERGIVVDLEVPDSVKGIKTWRTRGIVQKLSKTPGKQTKPPFLGQHNHEVLTQCGYTVEEIDALQQKWTEKYTPKK